MTTRLFGLTLMNVPIVNLRQEFRHHLRLFSADSFRANLAEHGELFSTDYVAYATRQALLTHVLQRTVMGIEAYLPWAVLHEGGLRRVLTNEVFARARDPFSLGGRGAVANYYDRLPAQIDPTASLRVSDPQLYEATLRFYREIRNPLFHGHEVHNDERGDATLEALQFVERLYHWIDSWCPPEDMFKKSREAPIAASDSEKTEEASTGRVTFKLRIPTLKKP